MKQLPYLTFSLTVLSIVLMLLPETWHTKLYFDRQLLANGHVWGLLSGHWLHAGTQHLLWNAPAFALLASLIELRSRWLLVASLLVGTVSVDLLLLSPLVEIQRYCGLSGILNTLLGVALCLVWRETRSAVVLVIAVLSTLKIVIEINSGHSIFTDINWPPFPLAHLAGLLGTPVAMLLHSRRKRGGNARIRGTNENEYLVTSQAPCS